MDVQELFRVAREMPFEKFEQALNALVRENYRYKNLNENNKKLILNLIKGRINNIRNGTGISYTIIQEEMYKLSQNRVKLGLSETDIKQVKEILSLFKK